MRRSHARFLFGTVAYHAHAQNMARALYEDDALYAYVTGGVDTYRARPLRLLRGALGSAIPRLDRELKRRAIDGLPDDLVVARWGWEAPRVLAGRLGCHERVVDWLWEHGELALDRACARLATRPEVGGFMGIEYGSLASLQAARALGKPGVVAFVSPHHHTLATWVDSEYEKFPELATSGRAYFRSVEAARNGRRDREAELADWIVTGSSFTTRSLVEAGFSAAKMITVPLGGPTPVPAAALPSTKPSTVRVVYVGPVSVRKGAHYLLRAWNRVAKPGMELHLYGQVLIPDETRRSAQAGAAGRSIVFHGSVPARDLVDVYLRSSVLVLPSLCDGFGQVVSDALAHGLPAITTCNAGAADLIEDGRTGVLIPPADEDALARAIEWCADHPQELFDMRRPALAAAANWTWKEFRARFTELLGGSLARMRTAAPAEPIALGVAG